MPPLPGSGHPTGPFSDEILAVCSIEQDVTGLEQQVGNLTVWKGNELEVAGVEVAGVGYIPHAEHGQPWRLVRCLLVPY